MGVSPSSDISSPPSGSHTPTGSESHRLCRETNTEGRVREQGPAAVVAYGCQPVLRGRDGSGGGAVDISSQTWPKRGCPASLRRSKTVPALSPTPLV